MQYRKKPVVVEAVQFHASEPGDPLTFSELPEWLNEAFDRGDLVREYGDRINGGDWDFIRVTTLEGDHLIGPGYYIIKGVENELYGCEPAIFKKTYEDAESIEPILYKGSQALLDQILPVQRPRDWTLGGGHTEEAPK